MTVDVARIEAAVREILFALGESPERMGLRDTPRRVAEAYTEIFSGIDVDPASVVEPLPGERGEGLIMVRDIPLVGVCEHHLLPFIGTAAVGYLPGPDGRICGLSKLARVIDVLSKRLQVQERLVSEAADAIEKALAPRGVFVLAEAEHLCMTMRGAQKPGSITVTTEVRGAFRDEPALRAEALSLARDA
jgi:GTP cyclohydrolase IA